MNCSLRWRQAEDQPAASRIDVVEAEHVGKEGAIGLGIAAEEDEVRPVDHVHILPLWCTDSWRGNAAHAARVSPYDTMSVIGRRFVGA